MRDLLLQRLCQSHLRMSINFGTLMNIYLSCEVMIGDVWQRKRGRGYWGCFTA